MKKANPQVDIYLNRVRQWQAETRKLRTILLGCELTEELKWGKPCYVFQESNIVVIQGFKAYCALLFFKGCLLKDPDRVLQKTGENTRVGRQIRFIGVQEIVELQDVVKAYVAEAIEVEKAGLKIEPPKTTELVLPAEFKNKLDENPALETAFHALTPGRQRAYNFYFSAPKQSKTRNSRVEKWMQQILNGKGLND